MNLHEYTSKLLDGYAKTLKPFLEKYSPERVEQFDAEVARCKRLSERQRRELPVCVLGQSGVGKSTLLNALLDGRTSLLPQGGIGPLTAQATRVRYSAKPYFRVSYLPGNRLNQLLFAILKHHEAEQRNASASSEDAAVVAQTLSEEEVKEAVASLPAEDVDLGPNRDAQVKEGTHSKVEGYRHQANLMVRGKQYEHLDVPYLAHCLRYALGIPSGAVLPIEFEDQKRLDDIKAALVVARSQSNERLVQFDGDRAAFHALLKAHVTGHLAPLIKTIEVGWDNVLLRDGLVLVDLPGVGVANDEYRKVTAEAIRSARAVVLVVDRSGFTEASAELLRATGFLNSLLHDASDAEADVPTMLVCVVKLDLTADDEWTAADERGEDPRPWVEYFQKACAEAQVLVRDQVRNELRLVAVASPDATRQALLEMVERTIAGMKVHTVSAPQYRRLSRANPQDQARISKPADSNIPQMAAALQLVAAGAINEQRLKLRQQTVGIRSRVSTVLELLRDQWESDDRLAAEIEQLRLDLDLKIKPLRDEYRDRRANFRGFLRETVPEKIEGGVYKATDEARREIDRYLRQLYDYHWATLRATVRRGGAFVGARHVDLPNELTLRFEQPVAVVWSAEILSALRKRTREWGEDLVSLQAELVTWAREQGARVDHRRVERIHEELKSGAAELGTVGREAVNELKESVRTELFSKVENRVRKKCQKFVEDRQAEGPGTKARILAFFGGDLVDAVLEVARESAAKVLTSNYQGVQSEIEGVLKRFPDPLQTAAEHVVDSHEISRKRADVKELKAFQDALRQALSVLPSEDDLESDRIRPEAGVGPGEGVGGTN